MKSYLSSVLIIAGSFLCTYILIAGLTTILFENNIKEIEGIISEKEGSSEHSNIASVEEYEVAIDTELRKLQSEPSWMVMYSSIILLSCILCGAIVSFLSKSYKLVNLTAVATLLSIVTLNILCFIGIYLGSKLACKLAHIYGQKISSNKGG